MMYRDILAGQLLNFWQNFFPIMLQVTFAVGLGLIVYAAKAGGEDWQEFIRYFRESKLVSTPGYTIWFSPKLAMNKEAHHGIFCSNFLAHMQPFCSYTRYTPSVPRHKVFWPDGTHPSTMNLDK